MDNRQAPGAGHEHWVWKVLYREHGWQSNAGDQSGFIDLALQKGMGPYVIVLECKRVKEADWVFLVAEGEDSPTNKARMWITNRRQSDPDFFGYCDVLADPPSPVSMFCVLDGHSDAKSRPMLERVAAELCQAVEALAAEETRLPAMDAEGGRMRMYAGVIVTNARLILSQLDPALIDLQSGTALNAKHKEVPWLRFRKHFSDKFAVTATAPTFAAAAAAKEKSVFIVNVRHLNQFLDEWDVNEHALRPLLRQGIY